MQSTSLVCAQKQLPPTLINVDKFSSVNNAGLAMDKLETTDAGWEMTMAVWY